MASINLLALLVAEMRLRNELSANSWKVGLYCLTYVICQWLSQPHKRPLTYLSRVSHCSPHQLVRLRWLERTHSTKSCSCLTDSRSNSCPGLRRNSLSLTSRPPCWVIATRRTRARSGSSHSCCSLCGHCKYGMTM
jgi:hypothetical protein